MDTLQAGDTVPNFTVNDEAGNTVSLNDYKGKKLVVFFYPKASTPGCTAEACNLRDNYNQLQDEGYQLLGVSADSEKRQSNFKKKSLQLSIFSLLKSNPKVKLFPDSRVSIRPNLLILNKLSLLICLFSFL